MPHYRGQGNHRQADLSRRDVLRLFGIAALSLGGCVGLQEPGYTIDISEENRYLPATLQVPVGSRVAWKNRDTRIHTATFDPALLRQLIAVDAPLEAPLWDSGNLDSGQIWSVLLETPGEYVYFCRYHGAQGMVGKIDVIA